MSGLDKLPPDQLAVLQMVLSRGRSYDQIAGLLSIDREAVRRRALDALETLTPAAVGATPERALIGDYLLGQLSDAEAEAAKVRLQTSDAEREWALRIAAVIAPFTSGSLPEIPARAPLGADDRAIGDLEPRSDPSGEPAQTREPRPPRPGSRRGGAILLSTIGALILAGILVAVLSSGGAAKAPGQTSHGGSPTTVPIASTPSGTGTSTVPPEQLLAQLNLTSPAGASATVGIVQVVRFDREIAIVVAAQGLPPNPAHTAYAVWLYNSTSSYRFVDYFPTLVGKSGKLAGVGVLKPGAGAYHRILITLETHTKPSKPGQVVLSGPFRER